MAPLRFEQFPKPPCLPPASPLIGLYSISCAGQSKNQNYRTHSVHVKKNDGLVYTKPQTNFSVQGICNLAGKIHLFINKHMVDTCQTLF